MLDTSRHCRRCHNCRRYFQTSHSLAFSSVKTSCLIMAGTATERFVIYRSMLLYPTLMCIGHLALAALRPWWSQVRRCWLHACNQHVLRLWWLCPVIFDGHIACSFGGSIKHTGHTCPMQFSVLISP